MNYIFKHFIWLGMKVGNRGWLVESCLSDWRPITSGEPRGSLLGSLLVFVSIKDLHVNVDGTINNFGNDIKIGSMVDNR